MLWCLRRGRKSVCPEYPGVCVEIVLTGPLSLQARTSSLAL